jgi:hypothetical protein
LGGDFDLACGVFDLVAGVPEVEAGDEGGGHGFVERAGGIDDIELSEVGGFEEDGFFDGEAELDFEVVEGLFVELNRG